MPPAKQTLKLLRWKRCDALPENAAVIFHDGMLPVQSALLVRWESIVKIGASKRIELCQLLVQLRKFWPKFCLNGCPI
jgi:hypothetical protein